MNLMIASLGPTISHVATPSEHAASERLLRRGYEKSKIVTCS